MIIYIGVGSNIDPKQHIRDALKLTGSRGLLPAALSTHYKTIPVKHKENPFYINGVWQIETDLKMGEVKTVLTGIESELGRQKHPEDPYASRTIDLDILWCRYENYIHRDVLERNFVYIPLMELDKDLILPDGTPLAENVNGKMREGMIPLFTYTRELRSIIDG